MDALLPEDPARAIWRLLEELDLSKFDAPTPARGSAVGRPAIDPMILGARWLYGRERPHRLRHASFSGGHGCPPGSRRWFEGCSLPRRSRSSATRAGWRQSKIGWVAFVMALVLTARTSAGGRQAEALRHCREATRQKKLVRGAFYARFT